MSQPLQISEEEKVRKAREKEERRLAHKARLAAELKEKSTASDESKSKADLKRERREKQEAQRAVKQEPSSLKKSPEIDTVDFLIQSSTKESLLPQSSKIHSKTIGTQKNVIPQPTKPLVKSSRSSISSKKDQIFVHLPTRETDLNELTRGLGYAGEHIHPSIIRIGLKMNQNMITDPTNRCIAFLVALKSVIVDYEQTPSKQISRDLEQKFDRCVLFLERCRPLSVSMRNVIRIMRSYISKLNPDLKLEEAKKQLINLIDKFMYEEIECGLVGIREHGNLKINQDDVILTFGNSFLIQHILQAAKKSGKLFRVIVVDSNPRLDGKKLVEFLNQLDIHATYVLISALSYVMKEVKKVLIEAHTLLANGYMISEMGSSQIALVAKAHNVPVLICCETYKFSERVHTDSFVFNEADTAKDFLNTQKENSDLRILFDATNGDKCTDKNQPSNLNILNLYYDVTPRDFISLVITEMGFLPSTAVPVIIRRNICKFQLDG